MDNIISLSLLSKILVKLNLSMISFGKMRIIQTLMKMYLFVIMKVVICMLMEIVSMTHLIKLWTKKWMMMTLK
jgi:hypothetical protein